MAHPKDGQGDLSIFGFCEFYHKFICDYSKIVVLLIALTRKNQTFEWTASAQEAFDELRSQFMQAPILLHPNFDWPFIVETNASKTAIGGILSQHGDDGHLHPYAYYNSKMSLAEQNYDIFDKKLLNIVFAFQN